MGHNLKIDEDKGIEKEAKEKTGKGFILMARLGYISKGFVYMLAGILTLLASFGLEESPKGTQGSLSEVADKPFGEAILWAIAIGLAGYVSWKLVQVFLDPDKSGKGLKGIARRGGHLFSAAIYTFILYKAVSFALHTGRQAKGQGHLEGFLSTAPGRWMVIAVGVGVIAYGIKEIAEAYNGRFTRKLKKQNMSQKEIKMGKKSGEIGLAARGAVFCFAGYLAIQATVISRHGKLIGMDETMKAISEKPYGKTLNAAVAAGLICYGLFQVIKGRRRSIKLK